MTDKTKDRIAKIYALVERGVDGEKDAAKAALNRYIKKYNLDEESIANINKREYRFKYATWLDMMLFQHLANYLLDGAPHGGQRDTFGKKEFVVQLEYLDYVTIDCSYEYFRRHARTQFNTICLPKINRCRKASNKKKRRLELQTLFFDRYVIASNLYREADIRKVDTSAMSSKELSDRISLHDVEGGNYKQQMTTGLYLEQ